MFFELSAALENALLRLTKFTALSLIWQRCTLRTTVSVTRYVSSFKFSVTSIFCGS